MLTRAHSHPHWLIWATPARQPTSVPLKRWQHDMDKVKQQKKAPEDNSCALRTNSPFYPNTKCSQAYWADVHEHSGRREVNHAFRQPYNTAGLLRIQDWDLAHPCCRAPVTGSSCEDSFCYSLAAEDRNYEENMHFTPIGFLKRFVEHRMCFGRRQ